MFFKCVITRLKNITSIFHILYISISKYIYLIVNTFDQEKNVYFIPLTCKFRECIVNVTHIVYITPYIYFTFRIHGHNVEHR